MAILGVNCDKLGAVNADSLHWLGSRINRIVAAPDHPMEQLAYVRSMKNAGQQVLMVFDHDAYRHFGAIDDPTTWRQAANWGRAVYAGLVDAIEPVNEPDGEGFESSPATGPIVNGMLEAHARAWGTNMQLVGCATSSGQPDWYTKNHIRMDLIDKLSFHPYAQWTPESLTKMIDRHAVLGRMLWITEVGLNTNDTAQAEFLAWTLDTIQRHPQVEVCTWFCAHAYGDWGLSRADGTWRPAARVFKEMAMAPPDPPPNPYTFQLGFKDMYESAPDIVGDARENEKWPHPGTSQQWTTNGMLWWCNTVEGGSGMGFTANDLKRYLWDGSRLNEVTS